MAVTLGWMPNPEAWRLWPDVLALLDMASGDCATWCDGDLLWLALDGQEVIGAATTRLTVDGAELKHVAGVRSREWRAGLDAMICEWARRCGCKVIRARGRRGWGPWVRRLGWVVTGREDGRTLYEKAL